MNSGPAGLCQQFFGFPFDTSKQEPPDQGYQAVQQNLKGHEACPVTPPAGACWEH